MSARADLCGGRSAMIVPTATSYKPDRYRLCMVRRRTARGKLGAIDKSAAMYSAFCWRLSLLAMMSSAACLSLQVGRSRWRPLSVSG